MNSAKKVLRILREEGLPGLAARINKDVGLVRRSAPRTGKTCLKPFYYASIHLDGRVYCCCPGWLKFPLGRLSESTGTAELWNGRMARTFREAMAATELGRVCKCGVCPHILDGGLPDMADGEVCFSSKPPSGPFPRDIAADPEVLDAVRRGATQLDYLPKSVEIAADARCNLACPSCRDDRITQVSAENEHLLDLVRKNIEVIGPQLRHLHLLGSGEALFSPFTRQLLQELDSARYPGLAVHLLTNGQLLTPKVWNQLRPGTGLVREISVSIDAATKATYEVVRRPGRWERLLDNLEFMHTLREDGPVEQTSINFVVSAQNYKEMPDFVRMGERFGVDRVVFTTLQPWSGMGLEYRQAAVHLPSHPGHEAFQRVLADPACRSTKVVFGVDGTV